MVIVSATEHHHRVLGQLVLALRESRLLAGAHDIDYTLTTQDVIHIDWVEGAGADEVAAGLVAYSAAGLLGFNAVASRAPESATHSSITVDGLPVVLRAFQPIGLERASRIHRPRHHSPKWVWPFPLLKEGAARDTVLWELTREDGTLATVVRLPIDVDEDEWWTESSFLVATPEHDAPAGVWTDRRIDVDRARQLCSVLLRLAPPECTIEEADDWMATELASVSRIAVAVAWRDRCVMRLGSGLRMVATCPVSPYQPSWSHVPAALMSSMCHPRPIRKRPPATMKVRVFGDAYSVATLSVASDLCAPLGRYSR